MNIQPAFSGGQAAGAVGATATSFNTNGGSSSGGAGEGMRADWHVRMNVSHETGFVGGAGRLLVHNLIAEEKRELVLLLPAALQDRPGRLELTTASVCSTKPGLAAQPGDRIDFRVEGAKAVLTLPVLQLNDWMYLDITWTGGFAQGGASFLGGQVPVGDFHPQIAVPVVTDTGQQALAPLQARYDVELGTDVGAVVRLDGTIPEHGAMESKPSEDGAMTMHEFKNYGSPRIEATIAPPGAGIA